MVQDIKKKLIKNYQKRKLWYGNNSFRESVEFFEIETARAGIKKNDNILEIGFGEGLFLEWTRKSGFNITGVEINRDFYDLAKEQGHNVYLGDVKDIFGGSKKKYNGIFLFDVLEHLTLEEISNLFDFFQTILEKKGSILARFPNGGSPFGRFLQHSDATHVTALTGSKIQDIVQLSGLEVKGIYNGARTKRTGAHKNWILKWIAYGLRDIIQLIIGYLYYGENIPLDPNLTIVIGHVSEEEL
ncbi:MAG: class I SAM-dependent methyltransferase [Desulfobacula sp.]|uniref:class I SAM-dependent methyltransferase n=1 Tax=Desulfobacula sp. TaxID=2593537 RepID=UPI0025BB9D12|nr:class I SAM-dependent methyltransferase [Desulfobacula sp.]MCD4722742.1 class I SAM-dependent methyltransferase [Desulfobacula sp.]